MYATRFCRASIRIRTCVIAGWSGALPPAVGPCGRPPCLLPQIMRRQYPAREQPIVEHRVQTRLAFHRAPAQQRLRHCDIPQCITRSLVEDLQVPGISAAAALRSILLSLIGGGVTTVTVADPLVALRSSVATAYRGCVPAAMFVTANWNAALLTLPTGATSEENNSLWLDALQRQSDAQRALVKCSRLTCSRHRL